MSFTNKVCKLKDFYNGLGGSDSERTPKMAQAIDDLLESKDGKPAKMRPEDFSLLEIFEAVPPSAFPIVTGKVLSNKIMQAYNFTPTVHQQLVENMPSNLLVDRVPGAQRTGDFTVVNPGQNYQHTGSIEEKWAQIVGQKFGKILDITEEMIKFDQIGLVLRTAGRIGEDAALFKEKLCLYGVIDHTGYKSWYPNTTPETAAQADLYQNAQSAPNVHEQDNLITDALADIDDLNAALYLLQLMKDDGGNPILIRPTTLLVPVKLSLMARRLIQGPTIKGQNNHEVNPFQGDYNIVSSPFLDMADSYGREWFLGDFKKQFVWKEVIPIQVLTRMDDKNDAAWERDIKAQYKVRLYGALGAVDYRYVVKSAGTA